MMLKQLNVMTNSGAWLSVEENVRQNLRRPGLRAERDSVQDERTEVKGARHIWATMKTDTPIAIKNALNA